MSVRISSAVWSQAITPPTRKLILLSLADFANDDGICFPSHRTTARRCGISVRQAREHVAALTTIGELRKLRAGGGLKRDDGSGRRAGWANTYLIRASRSDAELDAAAQRWTQTRKPTATLERANPEAGRTEPGGVARVTWRSGTPNPEAGPQQTTSEPPAATPPFEPPVRSVVLDAAAGEATSPPEPDPQNLARLTALTDDIRSARERGDHPSVFQLSLDRAALIQSDPGLRAREDARADAQHAEYIREQDANSERVAAAFDADRQARDVLDRELHALGCDERFRIEILAKCRGRAQAVRTEVRRVVEQNGKVKNPAGFLRSRLRQLGVLP